MNKAWLLFLFAAATVVYVIGLMVPVMDVDAAQYASISREMLANKSYFKVFNNGTDYLDKPPLIFWLSVLSFKIFGVSTISYKFPSFLLTLLGVYSTFRLAALLYEKRVAQIAALIIYTCQAFFLFNNDVRTDTLLTAWVIFSCWQLIMYAERKQMRHLLLGFAGMALALMAKGPIGAVIPAAAIFFHFIIKRKWSSIFMWQWMAGAIFALLLLVPMCIGLYRQFGLEGVKFFFWTQSFGRITGENVWKNNTGYFYFSHVFLWSFLPWSLLFVMALASAIKELWVKKFSAVSLREGYTLGGILLPFFALSFSHYKLPHYIFVVYPLAAIFAAAWLERQFSNSGNRTGLIQFVQCVIIMLMSALILFLIRQYFPLQNLILWSIIIAGIAAAIYLTVFHRNRLNSVLFASAVIAIMVNAVMNAHIYPSILKYQSGSELAFVLKKEQSNLPVYFFGSYQSYAFSFYSDRVVVNGDIDLIKGMLEREEELWLLGTDDLMRVLTDHQITPVKVYQADDFHITTLTLKFLNPHSRPATLQKVYLVKI